MENELKNKKERRPDALLVDLFWNKENTKTRRTETDKIINKFDEVINELKSAIATDEKVPAGISYLTELENDHKSGRPPILIYTQAGQHILDTENLKRAYNHVCILKKWYPNDKRVIINQVIESHKTDYDVFISHADADNNLASEIETLLKKQITTMKVFLTPACLSGGSPQEQTIRNALRKSRVIVVLLTRQALTRPNVIAEIGAGWGLEKPLYVGCLGMTSHEILAGTPSMFMPNNKYVHINTQKEKEAFIDEIIKSLS